MTKNKQFSKTNNKYQICVLLKIHDSSVNEFTVWYQKPAKAGCYGHENVINNPF